MKQPIKSPPQPHQTGVGAVLGWPVAGSSGGNVGDLLPSPGHLYSVSRLHRRRMLWPWQQVCTAQVPEISHRALCSGPRVLGSFSQQEIEPPGRPLCGCRLSS